MNSAGTFSSIGLILYFKLHVILWSLGLAVASNQCPVGQYLDRSSSCVDCKTCQPPSNILIPCHGRNNTVCKYSITDLLSWSGIIQDEKQLPSKDKNQKKLVGTENGNARFESVDSYNIMLGGPKHKLKKNNDAVTVYEDGKMELHNSFVGSDSSIQLSSTRSFDRNGKHIKKDLSSIDENQTSKPNDISRNPSSNKKLSKSKKTKDEPPNEDDKLTPVKKPDFIKDRVSTKTEPRKNIPIFFSGKAAAEIPSFGSRKILNKTKPLDSDEDEYDNSQLDENISEDEEAEDVEYGNDDENEDDDDEEDNAGEVDEDFDPPIDKVETSEKPFGAEDTILADVQDDDYAEEATTRNRYEVNVEPYIDTTNWQLLILVSAASACFLFFVVVNTYLCIYMKRWRHMKQDFEAGVEDLSVRINLMQHAGFEADESNNIRNYITQLRGEKSCTEKSKSTP